jgi:molybdopterin-guanine dinucleotide biosynthesis protein A
LSGNSSVTTVILAGGQGRRMGGDKAQRELRGRPLIAWVIGRIEPQCAHILISTNGNEPGLAHWGLPLVSDLMAGHAGPLAGLHAAMHVAGTEWVASVPCDTPYLPDDLLARLLQGAGEADAAVAVAAGRRQPTIAIYRRYLLQRLEEYLEKGGRKAGDWLKSLDVREVEFGELAEFDNFNTPEELDAANGRNGS